MRAQDPIVGLESIASRIRGDLASKSDARDKALTASRELIRHCSLSIRAVHRDDFAAADVSLAAARSLVAGLESGLAPHPDLFVAGYVQDALKEYAEARTVYALVRGDELPRPEEIHVPYPAYLNGLGESVGELRRHVLDSLRRGSTDGCEEVLRYMDDIYTVLATMDFPDALTGNLRRITDVARSIVEKTRGDLTYALQQQELEKAMAKLERRLCGPERDESGPARSGSAGSQ